MKTYQEFVSEAKKCWPGYKKKGTQKLFGKTYNRCVKAEEVEIEEDWSKSYKRSIDCNNPKGFSQKAHCAGRKKRAAGGETKSTSPFKEMYEVELEEGKVEWDNPKRPLQSGLTPREKNRAVRKRLGVEDPDTSSFFKGGPSEKDYERYGKLKAAHDTEKDKKVPKEKLHKFKSVAKGRLGGEYSAGRIRRMAGVHKGASAGRSAEKGTGSHSMMSQVQGGKERREKNIKRYGDYADLKRLKEPK